MSPDQYTALQLLIQDGQRANGLANKDTHSRISKLKDELGLYVTQVKVLVAEFAHVPTDESVEREVGKQVKAARTECALELAQAEKKKQGLKAVATTPLSKERVATITGAVALIITNVIQLLN